MLSPDTKRRVKSAVTASAGVGGAGLLAHLRDVLREKAYGRALEQVDGAELRFDTIPRIAHEEVRKAYIAILDDPATLEALKRELLP